MTDYELMGAALEEAARAAALGEVPVGAVVARNGEIIAAAHNTRETEKNALHHAELLAIDAACKKLGGWRLWQCELFVTLEPCPMCSGGIINSRIRRVVYGAADTKAGCCGSVTDLFALPFNHHPAVESGLLAVQCDVASRASCEVAFHTVEQAVGHVDVLVSNAGIAQQKLFTDITPEEWQHMLDVNLSGAFHLCQLALPGMIRRKAGRILTVSSMWGQTGGSCEVHYSAAKAGLIGLTKALAKEEGPSGITVNCVAPGVIDTDMMAAFTAEDKAALAEETPVGRLGSADEVAQLLVFLAGESAGYITGQVFGVNGGLVI